MNELERMINRALSQTGMGATLDIAESLGLITKTFRKRMEQKFRYCSNGNMAMICKLPCPFGVYGSRTCKKFRKQYDMKIKHTNSPEDILSGAPLI